LIRHVRTLAVAMRLHRIAVIGQSFRAVLVVRTRSPACARIAERTTAIVAVHVSPVAAPADEKDREAPAARPHPQHFVHVPVHPDGE